MDQEGVAGIDGGLINMDSGFIFGHLGQCGMRRRSKRAAHIELFMQIAPYRWCPLVTDLLNLPLTKAAARRASIAGSDVTVARPRSVLSP